MAIDMTAKTLDLASKICDESGALMHAVRRLVALKEEAERAGILFEPDGVPVDFANTALAHVNGTGINNALTSTVAVKTFLDANFHTDNFDHARP